MTFADWYAANIAPTIPHDVPAPVRQAARESMAACWNAAIDEAARWLSAPSQLSEEARLMANALQVTTVDGVVQKFRQ